ncbi:MAG: hypothetical protein AAGF30_01390 [Pseudomonadota bacterium]
MRIAIALVFLLSACAKLPPEASALSTPNDDLPAPRLVPLSPLLAEAKIAQRAAPAGIALQSEGATLAGRALVPPVTGDLAARGARLRERAAALRDQEI